MEFQRFGEVETGKGLAKAMLCIDEDRPEETLLQLWGIETDFAVLLRGAWNETEPFALKPEFLYRVNEGGGLWLPTLSIEETTEVRQHRVNLVVSKDKSIDGTWESPSGQRGKMRFHEQAQRTEIQPTLCSSWTAFKEWTNSARSKHDAVTFRGHGTRDFRLRTTFHRMGRHRLERYCAETLPEFRGHVEALLVSRFDLSNRDDYAVVLGLAQHHGLPTPLLDWTGSPYVAAFFAFADAMDSAESRPEATHVRVYGLTREFVDAATLPVVTLPFIRPYVAPLTISPRNNPRLYAQQGQFLVTNVADVERYLVDIEKTIGKTFLIAADVPITYASEALEDLAFMGLTAATMFPGLDGVCRMMKHAMTFKRARLPIAGEPSNNL